MGCRPLRAHVSVTQKPCLRACFRGRRCARTGKCDLITRSISVVTYKFRVQSLHAVISRYRVTFITGAGEACDAVSRPGTRANAANKMRLVGQSLHCVVSCHCIAKSKGETVHSRCLPCIPLQVLSMRDLRGPGASLPCPACLAVKLRHLGVQSRMYYRCWARVVSSTAMGARCWAEASPSGMRTRNLCRCCMTLPPQPFYEKVIS